MVEYILLIKTNMELTDNYQKHTSKNPLKKLLINYFYKTLLVLLADLRIKTVLDAGCGEGFTLNRLKKNLPNKVYSGIDSSPKAIKLGKKLFPELKLRLGNIYYLPYKNQTFDLVICTEVLEHLAKPTEALREIRRVSKKYCLLSVPNDPWFRAIKLGNDPEHINHWSKNAFTRWLRKNRVNILKTKTPFPWTVVLTEV